MRRQFEFLGKWLAKNGWDVRTAYRGDDTVTEADNIRSYGCRTRGTDHRENDFRYPLDYAAQNALGATRLFFNMRDGEDYVPDVVIAHVGWGIGLCVKQVWPTTKYIAYHEWYYTEQDWTKGGKAERPVNVSTTLSNRMRNLPIVAEFDCADASWCPTEFQKSRFPPALQPFIEVLPDGVDCQLHRGSAVFGVDFEWLGLPVGGKVLTYTTRGMEPLRGFPQFLRAVEELQRRRSDFDTVILASDTVSYGAQLGDGDSWRLRMLDQLTLDQRRIHFAGSRPRDEYIKVLQASTAHLYFSEPFVTSWSLWTCHGLMPLL